MLKHYPDHTKESPHFPYRVIFNGTVTKDAAACYYLWKGYKDFDFIHDSLMLQWSIIITFIHLFQFTN